MTPQRKLYVWWNGLDFVIAHDCTEAEEIIKARNNSFDLHDGWWQRCPEEIPIPDQATAHEDRLTPSQHIKEDPRPRYIGSLDS